MKKYFVMATIGASVASIAHAEESFTDALIHGTPSADFRLRYEGVDQQNLKYDANAYTFRLRFGYQTGQFAGFGAFVEADTTTALGGAQYNSTVNGKTQYPIVADPAATQMNQAYVSYSGLSDTMLKYGRQRIKLDNERFIGAVDWRQNEQTFDAFTATNKSLPDTTITAGYLYNADRVFTDVSPQGNAPMESPIFNINYKGLRAGEIVGYGYLLKFTNPVTAPGLTLANSTQTYGLRFKGDAAVSASVKALYTAEYASQKDYGNNPKNFQVDYRFLEGGINANGYTFKLGDEVLGSNGTTAFQTPLATLHVFNGWADEFLTTPVNGLKDTYVSADTAVLRDLKLTAVYHDFRADQGSARYGTEWDFMALKPVAKNYAVGAAYATYNANSFFVDNKKLWLWLQGKF